VSVQRFKRATGLDRTSKGGQRAIAEHLIGQLTHPEQRVSAVAAYDAMIARRPLRPPGKATPGTYQSRKAR
jgi:hypothetical protein